MVVNMVAGANVAKMIQTYCIAMLPCMQLMLF